MIIIPAIDIKDGRCVRLRQGCMSDETIYSEYPEKMAERWCSMGAQRLHVVDLNGAVEGRPVNENCIKRILKSVDVPVQVGGGIRNLETIERYLNMGVSQVIIGTSALKRSFVEDACNRFPGKIILAIDSRDGKVAIEGWTAESTIIPVELARRYEGYSIFAIIFTDISRDGMSTGPNIDATEEFAKSINIPVIASGGISNIHDVIAISRLERFGVMGMITGRAIYSGSLNLKDAIERLNRIKT